MDIPDKVLLSFINLRHAFFDIKSKEKGTNRVKRKYKLLTQKGTTCDDLNIYIFNILTTTEDSYIKSKTINIYRSDWEYREKACLDADYSKLSTQEIDVISKDSLLEKIRDKDNGFYKVGTLMQYKFTEVINFIKKDFEGTDKKTDFNIREIVTSLFNKTPVAKNIINKFDI